MKGILICTSAVLSLVLQTGCVKSASSFSMLAELQEYEQTQTAIDTKLDIMWVVDNSGSMATSQENVANNFASFINRFLEKDYDFKIAVSATDAYRTLHTGDPLKSKFRDGTDQTSHTGIFVITPSTVDLINTFIVNVTLGIIGSGDERAFLSIKTALEQPLNTGFLRDDSFFATIIVSDEDDFSYDGPTALEDNYDDARIHSVQSYVDYLDHLTGSSPLMRRYSVSSMAIFDQDCLDQLNAIGTYRKIAIRYKALTEATDGIKASLCGDFATSLDDISKKIAILATRFKLTRPPDVASIRVFLNGMESPRDVAWVYDPIINAIIFNISHIPHQGDKIFIQYDPLTFGS